MEESFALKTIAHIRSVFSTKFGIPRQSGLVESLPATVVFLPVYRNVDALRGLDGFSHIWLIWAFSEAVRDTWSPTVRPPRLGGNQRMGVFATRSPFRPNPIGLSCVRLEGVEQDAALGPILRVAGADLMDGTPIFDIKPYLPYADSQAEAVGGFAGQRPTAALAVDCPAALLDRLPEQLRPGLIDVLAQDPRPSYQRDPARVYGFSFGDFEIRFSVDGECLMVRDILPRKGRQGGTA